MSESSGLLIIRLVAAGDQATLHGKGTIPRAREKADLLMMKLPSRPADLPQEKGVLSAVQPGLRIADNAAVTMHKLILLQEEAIPLGVVVPISQAGITVTMECHAQMLDEVLTNYQVDQLMLGAVARMDLHIIRHWEEKRALEFII